MTILNIENQNLSFIFCIMFIWINKSKIMYSLDFKLFYHKISITILIFMMILIVIIIYQYQSELQQIYTIKQNRNTITISLSQKIIFECDLIITMQNIPAHNVYFILLINTKSGGGVGLKYLSLQKKQFSFQYKDKRLITISLIDLFDKQTKEKKLEQARLWQKDQSNDVRIIVCGGDGTIVWAVEECQKAAMDFQRLLFAPLPIGTGNDFSRTLNWGGEPIQFKNDNILPLKKRVIQWLQAEQSRYDIWEVQITTFNDGEMFAVKNKQDFSLGKQLIYKTGFVNYMGLGLDARISYHFQKHRTPTKFFNIVMYTLCGCRFWCKPAPKLWKTIQSFSDSCCMVQQSPSPLLKSPLNPSTYSSESKFTKLKPKYYNIIALNSYSYMAGALDAWQTTKIACQQKKNKFEKQLINDGKIEFLAYKTEMRLAMERIYHNGGKFAQGQGPFFITFKEDKQIQNYVQIDGEGIKVRNIKEIIIRKHTKIPNGSIRVMIRKQEDTCC